MSEWYVYIILTEKNRLYTGIATDIERRFEEHLGFRPNGAKFFRSDKPVKIVHWESYSSRSEASIRESAIKKLTRIQKEKILTSF